MEDSKFYVHDPIVSCVRRWFMRSHRDSVLLNCSHVIFFSFNVNRGNVSSATQLPSFSSLFHHLARSDDP